MTAAATIELKKNVVGGYAAVADCIFLTKHNHEYR